MFSRTPDEIKQGLMCLVGGEELEDTCGGCAYLDTRGPCVDHVLPDVLALVEQLQATVSEKEKVIAELSGKIGQLEADNKLLQDAVDQWEFVAASPGAVEDMARENSRLMERVKHLEQDCRNMIEIWEGMTKYVRQLEAERDAAVETVKQLKRCADCKHATIILDMTGVWVDCPKRDGRCSAKSLWEWSGVTKEGTA